MKTIQKTVLSLILCLTVVLPSAPVFSQSAKPVLNLAVFPRLNPLQSNRMYKPLTQYLSRQLGVEVVLNIPKDFPTFWAGLKQGKYDIVHYNQYHYVKSRKEFGYQVIVKNIEFNESTIAGAIIVRADSHIKSIADLKGKHVVFGGGTKAMQSYIVARYLLLQGGLKPGDYSESFAKNPPNAILSAYFKQAQAAGAGDKVLRLKVVKEQIDTGELRLLAKGEQLAHLPWAVKRTLPEKTKKKLQQLFLNMSKTADGKALLKKMQLDGFALAKDSDYDKHRHIIQKVLNESY